MLPPAPVTFSTTTVCPRLFVIRSAMMRAIVSVGPPAENGTTIVTGRAGKFCAHTALLQDSTATAKSRNRFMEPPLRTMVTLRSALCDHSKLFIPSERREIARDGAALPVGQRLHKHRHVEVVGSLLGGKGAH